MGNLLGGSQSYVRPVAKAAAGVAIALGALAPGARAQSPCLVVDAELSASYQGGCVGGKAEGQGTARGTATYTGGFHEGKKQGHGVKTWPWGDRYDGEFADDYKEGWGSYVWGKETLYAGDRYEGEFAKDRRNGYGVYMWGSGDSYAGPWKEDAIAGWATPMMIARYRGTNAAMEGIKAGARVCHESALGVSAASRTEAVAQQVDTGRRRVSIRVTALGPGPVYVAGRRVAVGDVVWDDPLNWLPCN